MADRNKAVMNKVSGALVGIRKRMEKKGGGGEDFMTLEAGKNVVRLLPPWKDGEAFFREVWMHNKVGPEGAFLVCPKKTEGNDGKCPICEESEAAFKKGDKKLGMALKARARYYFNAIKRGGEKDGVKILATGTIIASKIMTFYEDVEDGGDLTDVKNGNDVLIMKVGEGLNTNYDDTRVKEVKTPLSTDPKAVKELLAAMHDLDTWAKAKSYKEIRAIMDGVEMEEEPEEEEEEPSEESEEVAVDFDSMDRSELKTYIAEKKLNVKVFKQDSDDDIRAKIAEAIGTTEEEAPEEEEEEAPEEEAEEKNDDEPACFGDKDEYNLADKTCKSCTYLKKCGVTVKSKK